MKLLIISSSLNPNSRSRKLARIAEAMAEQEGADVDFLDLQDFELPHCDGSAAYQHPNVAPLGKRGATADAILLATPIYCYDIASSLKNFAELTGREWSNKPVGFLCAAGGQNSYMSVMSFANSIMLDFRCHVVPRFVYSGKWHFDENDNLVDEDARKRIHDLVTSTCHLAEAIQAMPPAK